MDGGHCAGEAGGNGALRLIGKGAGGGASHAADGDGGRLFHPQPAGIFYRDRHVPCHGISRAHNVTAGDGANRTLQGLKGAVQQDLRRLTCIESLGVIRREGNGELHGGAVPDDGDLLSR